MYKRQNLLDLQKKLKEDGLKAYIVPTSDPHASEYVADRFMSERLYFCPFTGDAGTLVITQDNAYLFTDGRFFIQADKELAGEPYVVMKIGQKGVLPLNEFVKENDLYPLGVNMFNISYSFYNSLVKEGKEILNKDYAYMIENRPLLCEDKITKVDDSFFSVTADDKIEFVKSELKIANCEANLITTLDDIAFLLNCRGVDIACNPVFYSYLYISRSEGTHLFIDKKKIDFELKGVTVHEYNEIESFLEERKDVKTLVDESKINARLATILTNKVNGRNPSYIMKAIKGDVEANNTKDIQVLDGVAMIKFWDYLYSNLDNNLTEYQLSQKLKEYRLSNERCFDLSFETIAAVNANAAEMHYSPTAEKSSVVNGDCLELLVDSGGQYFGGTTDTTRTFLLGKPTEEYKHDYTLTLKSVIALSTSIFLEGSTGQTLDIKAREIMWKEGLDYKCGTGHGVGYMLNVHEGPNGFRYRRVAERDDGDMLVPGMITTVEPGVYKANKYGIRIENNLLCVPAFENENGTFYKFETITYVPIDTKPLDLSIMTDFEIEWLNNYHAKVREVLSEQIEDKHLLDLLNDLTKPIHR